MSKSCCFTGHRVIEYSEQDRLGETLVAEITQLVNEGFETFYAGGAIGFDTIAAKAVIKVREEYPEISLRLLLPCKGQENRWNTKQKQEYNEIMEQADSAEYISENYSVYAMHKRNKALVNRSDFCLCYLGTEKGGTAFTVRYAEENELKLKNLFPTSQISLFDEIIHLTER